MTKTSGAMHVAKITNRRVDKSGQPREYVSHLLRRTYREPAVIQTRLTAAAPDLLDQPPSPARSATSPTSPDPCTRPRPAREASRRWLRRQVPGVPAHPARQLDPTG